MSELTSHGYESPGLQKDAFHCPFCRVYATHAWTRHAIHGSTFALATSTCLKCGKHTVWRTGTSQTRVGGVTMSSDATEMLWPRSLSAPSPAADMPEAVKRDYNEAARVAPESPRAAAALLRLAVQRLTQELGQPGHNLNDDIGALVANGLPVGVQAALDYLRVTGNNAVHPGSIDVGDDAEAVTAMFDLLNYIVDQMITQPRERQALYSQLPEGAVAAIERRDAQTHARDSGAA